MQRMLGQMSESDVILFERVTMNNNALYMLLGNSEFTTSILLYCHPTSTQFTIIITCIIVNSTDMDPLFAAIDSQPVSDELGTIKQNRFTGKLFNSWHLSRTLLCIMLFLNYCAGTLTVMVSVLIIVIVILALSLFSVAVLAYRLSASKKTGN